MSEPSKRGRGRPRSIDRGEAVRIAMCAWWADGTAGVSLNEISRRMGLSKSSVYREFGGEDGLMAAALAQYRELSAVPLLALFERAVPPRELLTLVVRAATAERGLPAGCFFTNLRLRRSRLGDATNALVDAMIAERRAVFARWFETVRNRGEAHPSLSTQDAARYLDAQLHLILLRLASGDAPDDIREDATFALQALLAA